jgi:NhaP-type Na+/H+ or K+/H+ antiporter
MVPDFVLGFGLVALVLIATGLISGIVERSPVSFPLIFLGLGMALGGGGLGVIEIGPHDEVLEVVATLTLSLVLFLDAVKLDVRELGRKWVIPFLILGPGTLLIIAIGAVPFALIFGFGWLIAFMGGAILASTDPVVLREILRDERIPRSVRQVLRNEAGTNDLVVLPVLLVLIAVNQEEASSVASWLVFLGKLLVLGPLIGFAIGGAGAWLMAKADRQMGVRTEYQALYGVGLVLAAYAGATVAGGDGFLGAFAAGFAVVVLNQILCSCFLEYGETTAEASMLVTFILFGAVLSTLYGLVDWLPAIGMALFVVFVIRPPVLAMVLLKARMSWPARLFICWFGPRGLNSLLLALLVVIADVPGAEVLLAIVGVVVGASVILHGATALPMTAWYGKLVATDTLIEEREATAAALFNIHVDAPDRITPEELSAALESATPPILLDVRSRSTYEKEQVRIPGSVRVRPDDVIKWAQDNPLDRQVVAYCT